MAYLAFTLNLAALTLNVGILARADRLPVWNLLIAVITFLGVMATFPAVLRRLREDT